MNCCYPCSPVAPVVIEDTYTSGDTWIMAKKLITLVLGLVMASLNVLAEDKITREQIQEVIQAVDAAAENRDTRGIEAYLGEEFFKYIDVPSKHEPMAARLTREQYLDLIEKGWETIEQYSYRRKDVVINMSRDGNSGESYSTIIEKIRINGTDMTSKIREYARYELENGRPVIVNIESTTLVGDTTPELAPAGL